MKKLIILFLLLINVQAYALNVDAVLKSTDRNDGLCVIVNATDPELAIDLARRSKFSIHIIKSMNMAILIAPPLNILLYHVQKIN